ncbi:hypothetical protein C9980_25235 [Vibrio mediterranei]|jgi:hypothetical protein|uniref:Uncharacterized protein n=1 Tax=Vibrio mediterranei TaxID=689 RepID=A0AAN1FKY6_9VIBR|nr:hypothetical protein [Vibrio mediterranei]ASI92480.1 hypothetical protein BSZ05_22025 [Vibrio mediterranei]PTC02004.1 hypothetical protein C9980_25235 [Vibrio mediterranei]
MDPIIFLFFLLPFELIVFFCLTSKVGRKLAHKTRLAAVKGLLVFAGVSVFVVLHLLNVSALWLVLSAFATIDVVRRTSLCRDCMMFSYSTSVLKRQTRCPYCSSKKLD